MNLITGYTFKYIAHRALHSLYKTSKSCQSHTTNRLLTFNQDKSEGSKNTAVQTRIILSKINCYQLK